MVSSIPEALCTIKPRAMMVVMDSVLDVLGEVRGRVRAPAPAAMLRSVSAQAHTEATGEENLNTYTRGQADHMCMLHAARTYRRG